MTLDNPDDFTTALPMNGTELEHIAFAYHDEESDMWILQLHANKTGVYNFYVLAVSVSGKHVYLPFQVTIECAEFSQTITVNENVPGDFSFEGSDSYLYPYIEKNVGFVDALTPEMINAMFILSDPIRCPIIAFDIYDYYRDFLISDEPESQ